MDNIYVFLAILVLAAGLVTKSHAEDFSDSDLPAPTAASSGGNDSQASSGVDSDSGASAPKLMDGVTLEAIETYINPKENEVSLGLGIYPFDAYYYGLSVNGGYTYHPNRNFSWEILNAQYFFSFQKDLTTELADRYKVNPQAIPTLNYILSSDLQYVLSYGKFVLFENRIRYFRTSVFGGMGVVKTSDLNSFAATFGLKLQTFTRASFSWNFEARDSFAFSGTSNYLTFILGTGFSF